MGTCQSEMRKEQNNQSAKGNGGGQSSTKLKSNTSVSLQERRRSLDKRSRGILDQIRSIPIIQLCTDDQKISIAKKLVSRSFESGEVLMKEGDAGTEFFLISSGHCDVFVSGKKVSELHPNDYCGEQALLSSNCQRTATVKATKATSCLVMTKEQFDSIVRTTSIQFVNRRSANLALSEDEDDSGMSESETLDNDDSPAMDEDTANWLSKCVKGNVLFAEMDNEICNRVVRTMKKREISRSESIITQGDHKSKHFFVIARGEFNVIKDGKVVDTVGRGACVGELALIFNAPRNASIVCSSSNDKGQVWTLTRSAYRKQLTAFRQKEDEEKIAFLRKVPLLASLLHKEIALFARTLEMESFSAGQTIFRQGDKGEKFYLIMKGSARGVERRSDDGSEKVFTLSEGEWFGELALRYNKPRSATIAAQSQMTCLVSNRDNFNQLFGGLNQLMDRQIEEYQRKVQSDKSYRTSFIIKRTLKDLTQGPVVGRGKYGLVQLVKDPHTDTVYALKAIKKTWVKSKKIKQSKRRINALFNERNMMRAFSSDMNDNFLVKLRGTFKDDMNVYFLMQACVGGDIFNILKTKGYIDEKSARFYIACVIEGIDHLHSAQNMIHRDLKPENIVLDKDGYAYLTDFGFCKQLTNSSGDSNSKHNSGKTYTLCGTPGYMAPEVILGQGYGKGADWFAVGCVLYDMVTGAPPFPTRVDQFTMIRQMMQNKLHLPMYLSFWLKDLICQLLRLKPVKRLGVIHGGVNRIRNHKWFDGFDWEALRQRTLKPPFVPKLSSDMDPCNFDRSNIEQMNQEFDRQPADVRPLPQELLNWDVEF